VNGKLLFCQAPPGITDADFNEETHRIALRRAQGKKRAPVTRVGKNADTFVSSAPLPGGPTGGAKTNALDASFFQDNSNSSLATHAYAKGGQALTHRSQLFPHQNAVMNDGTPVAFREARIASVLANNKGETGKKHHKKIKKVKQRSGKGYDLE
jgi:large subunit GTPase 1